ncbi:thioredoxin family protein [bacterium]|nr:thioredoxin family protein [bacterium]
MEIKVLGVGCVKCNSLEQRTNEAAKQLSLENVVEKVSDINEITDLGILSVPALVINGKIKSVGKVPSVEQIVEWIKEEM